VDDSAYTVGVGAATLAFCAIAARALGLPRPPQLWADIAAAIRAAAAGRVYLCQSAATEMVACVRKSKAGDGTARKQLGGREEQVLRLIADGYSSKEIARNLLIAPSTVEVHRRNIMRKVGLHKVADLTRYAIRNLMVSV
jgi:two-component system NarL family response regulator